MKSSFDSSLLDKSINDVSSAIGDHLNTSIGRELSQTDQISKLDELKEDLLRREKTLAEEKYNLAKIQNELEEAKRQFNIEYSEADKNLEVLIQEELAKQTKNNDSFYMFDQKTNLLQELSRATRAKLVEMNDLELKLEDQRMHAESTINKFNIVSTAPSIQALTSQVDLMKEKLEDTNKQIGELQNNNADLERNLSKLEKDKNDKIHQSRNLQTKIESAKCTHLVHVNSLGTQKIASQDTLKNSNNKLNQFNDEKHDLSLSAERISAMIAQSDLLLKGYEDEMNVTKQNIQTKQMQLKDIKNDFKDMESRVNRLRKNKMEDMLNRERNIKDVTDQIQNTKDEIKSNSDKILHLNFQARKLEDSIKRTIVRIGQCVEDAAMLEHAKIGIDAKLERVEKSIENRSSEIDSQIEELNSLHRQIASSKFISKRLDRMNAIYFAPKQFDHDQTKAKKVYDDLYDLKHENKMMKKTIKFYEKRIFYYGAECAIIKNRQKQMSNAQEYTKKTLIKYGNLNALENNIKYLQKAIDLKKNNKASAETNECNDLLKIINREISKWN